MLSISRALFWGARSFPRNLSRTGHIANYHGKKPPTENERTPKPNLNERVKQIEKFCDRGQLKEAMELCKCTIRDYPKDEKAYQHLWSLWWQMHRIFLVPEHELEKYIEMYQTHISPPKNVNKNSDEEIKGYWIYNDDILNFPKDNAEENSQEESEPQEPSTPRCKP